MEHNNIVDKTLEKIKDEQVTLKPKWEFVLADIAKWSLFLLSGIIGALFVLFIFNTSTGADWDMRPRMGVGVMRLLFFVLPPAWLIFLIAALVLAFLFFRSTKYGYRYSMGRVALIVIGTIAAVSIVSFFVRADRFVGQRMPRLIPGYAEAGLMQERIWSQPEKGLLGGEIVTIDSQSGKIILRDFQNFEWQVSSDRNTRIPQPISDRITGKRIKVVGEKTGKFQFHALEVRSWNEEFQRKLEQGPRPPALKRRINHREQ